ncbi:MAG TPA: EF-P lysine aminoacylase EpmA [Caulobacterales bacterium]|nr:EF-P lysine aminoacylase EpmA [Caulobacterales bacterium]
MTTWKGAERHADKRPFLLARARILAAVRAWFAAEGFVEADLGAIVPVPGAETHISAFAIEGGYLHASPEFAMKGLLAAGERKIYRLGHVYRRGESGPLHAPEFTMLEWYRSEAPYTAIMDDCLAIIGAAAGAVDRDGLRWKGAAARVDVAPGKITVAEAFERFAGADVLSESVNAFGNAVAGKDDTWSDLFSRALTGRVEPGLDRNALTFLYEYPIAEAALARPCPHDRRVAERFELYACGVELANGYGELNDAEEQRRRFVAAMDEKERRYGERWPVPEAFLEALAHMPAASGCALGVDRLVMLLSDATKIDDVMWSMPS